MAAAPAAAQQPGQQRRPVPRRARRGRGLPVGGHPRDVRLVLFRGDVGRQPAGQQDQPLAAVHDHPPGAGPARHLAARLDLAAAVGVVPGVNRVVQHDLQRLPGRAPPLQLPLRRPGMNPDRQLDLLTGQVAEHAVEGAQPGEGAEDQPDNMLRLLVGIQDGLAGRAADVADRQRDGQLAALGLGEPARQHPLPDQVQLCLAHRSLQPQQQPVVIDPGVIDAVGIGEQHAGQRAQLQQLVPVPAGPRQPGHLDTQDDAHTSHRHLRDEPGKPLPGIGRRRRHPEIVVDHHDLRPRPAQRDRPPGERVLQPRGLRVLKHLLPARLADVHHRCPVQVLRADLLLRLPLQPVTGQAHHDRLPPPGRRSCCQHRQQRHRSSPPLRRQHRPDQETGSHRIPGTRPHRAHLLPLTAAGTPELPPATVLPRSVSPQIPASG